MSYILFFLGAFFVLLSLEGFWYETRGEEVAGVVVRKEARTHAKGKNYVRYRFQTKGGQTVEGRSEMLPQNFGDLLEGGPVAVEYILSSPDTNRVPGQKAGSLVFGCMAAATVAGGVALRRRERRRAVAKADAPAAPQPGPQ